MLSGQSNYSSRSKRTWWGTVLNQISSSGRGGTGYGYGYGYGQNEPARGRFGRRNTPDPNRQVRALETQIRPVQDPPSSGAA